MAKQRLLGLLTLVLVSSLISGAFAQAQIEFENPLEYETIEELIEAIVNFMLWVAIAITPLMVIIAAFYWLTSAGNQERIKTAKNIILWTCVGLALILFANGLISAIKYLLGG